MKVCFTLIFLCLVVFTQGCGHKAAPKVDDPCANASRVCWGKAGIAPGNVQACNELTTCFEWRMEAR